LASSAGNVVEGETLIKTIHRMADLVANVISTFESLLKWLGTVSLGVVEHLLIIPYVRQGDICRLNEGRPPGN